LPFERIPLGTISDDRKLALVYSAADIFVLPSLEDNLPNTAIESLACGTPIVAFKVGGIVDIVKHGNTGILADFPTSDSLANAIEFAIKNPAQLSSMGTKCVDAARQMYRPEMQSNAYISLFNSLI